MVAGRLVTIDPICGANPGGSEMSKPVESDVGPDEVGTAPPLSSFGIYRCLISLNQVFQHAIWI